MYFFKLSYKCPTHFACPIYARVLCGHMRGTTKPALPAAFHHAWNFTLEREGPEAQTANAELAQKCARPPAQLAAVVLPALELRFPCVLHSFCCRRHTSPVLPQGLKPLFESRLNVDAKASTYLRTKIKTSNQNQNQNLELDFTFNTAANAMTQAF
jgi:hypothetical protein